MKEKELFKIILTAYYENGFEEAVNNLLQKDEDNKIYLKKLIAALCGVEVNCNSNNYVNELKSAIEHYSAEHKIVTRLQDCMMDCLDSEGRTQCQNACAFEAISVDTEKHTTYIDTSKCIDCGFCIEACPNNNYIDKIEFLPLVHSL
jgi:Na+-translocating ferredoxin:NAD+ oxidoreductase RNF subunit RnfB